MIELKNPDNYTSSWDWCVAHSSYHFDNSQHDQEGEWYAQLGKFQGDWASEVHDLKEKTKPITWATRKFYGDNDDTVSPMLRQEENDLRNTGAPVELELTDMFDNIDQYPTLLAMANYFDLEDAKQRVHCQLPGQMFNLHIDKLWDRCPDNPARVVRITIMLEDWQPGQFYLYGTGLYSQWRAGEIHIFDWANVPHATANASRFPRSVLQITGIATDRTMEIIKHSNSDTVHQL